MLVIKHKDVDLYDEKSQQFYTAEGFTIELEHSLAALSKWETIWEKPFLSEEVKTEEETLSYIQQMCLGDVPTVSQLRGLTKAEMFEINKHINAKSSATWFKETLQKGRARETVTSEVVYYWMTVLNIPFEADKWHFNRLITLIKVANAKNAPQKKMSRRDMAAERRAQNAARLAKFNTNG